MISSLKINGSQSLTPIAIPAFETSLSGLIMTTSGRRPNGYSAWLQKPSSQP